MPETTVDDPIFGKLIWDGLRHGGWAGSFDDPQFLSWGSAITAALPDEDEEKEDEPNAFNLSHENFLALLHSISGVDKLQDEESQKRMQAARDFARRADTYDGSLDSDPLRKAGRLKVVVHNPRETPPTAAQQKAWRNFRKGGDALAERIASALLATYRKQRPLRLQWWKAIYGDSPKSTLPSITTTKAMRAIVRPSEFRIYSEQRGGAAIAVIFESFWCDKDIEVILRDGKVISIAPLEDPVSRSADLEPEEIESPVFGGLKRRRYGDGWSGVFHSDVLRGYDSASQMRYRFKKNPEHYASPPRPGPSWEAITGDFELLINCEEDQLPTPAQEAAFRKFNADPDATARFVLSAIFKWYKSIRPRWIKEMNGTPEEIASVMPVLRSPEGLLEIIQLQSVTVMAAPVVRPKKTPRAKAAKKISPQAKKRDPAILLSFHWEEEHGLAVRWRNGKIEKVGNWDTASNEDE